MSILNGGETIAFNEDYKRVLDAEDRAAAREALIEDEIAELLKEGGLCYPYSAANIFEALAQSSNGRQNVISAFFHVANKSNGADNLANHGLYVVMRNAVDDYCEGAAKVIATRNVDARLS